MKHILKVLESRSGNFVHQEFVIVRPGVESLRSVAPLAQVFRSNCLSVGELVPSLQKVGSFHRVAVGVAGGCVREATIAETLICWRKLREAFWSPIEIRLAHIVGESVLELGNGNESLSASVMQIMRQEAFFHLSRDKLLV